MSLALIDTGCANLASVRFALERLDAEYEVVVAPEEAVEAEKLILPGVGSAAPAMTRLVERGWKEALAADQRPLLGICLGMQLLFESSAEGDVDCLGLIPGRIEKLPRPDGLVWPHMGWNTLEGVARSEPLLRGLADGDRVYFVHGFYAPVGESTRAATRYGEACSAVVRQGHVAGCQFHPERSGLIGARILKNFVGSPA